MASGATWSLLTSGCESPSAVAVTLGSQLTLHSHTSLIFSSCQLYPLNICFSRRLSSALPPALFIPKFDLYMPDALTNSVADGRRS